MERCASCAAPTLQGCAKCRTPYCSRTCQSVYCGLSVTDLEEYKQRKRAAPQGYLSQLVGPDVVSYFRTTTGDDVVLFGEYHTPSPKSAFGTCSDERERLSLTQYGSDVEFTGTAAKSMDIVRYLYAAVQTAELKAAKTLDLYIELRYQSLPVDTESGLPEGNLNRLQNLFRDCLFDDKTRCELKHTRVHYVDYRGQTGIDYEVRAPATFAYTMFVSHILMYFAAMVKGGAPQFAIADIWEIIEALLVDDDWLKRWMLIVYHTRDPWSAIHQQFDEEWFEHVERLVDPKRAHIKLYMQMVPELFEFIHRVLQSMRYFKRDRAHVRFLLKSQKQLVRLRKEQPELWDKLFTHFGLRKETLQNTPSFKLMDTARRIVESTSYTGPLLDIIQTEVLDYLVKVMDIPALARVLRTFGQERARGIKIDYMGAAHQKAWVEFFRSSGLTAQVLEVRAETGKCLEVERVPRLQNILKSLIAVTPPAVGSELVGAHAGSHRARLRSQLEHALVRHAFYTYMLLVSDAHESYVERLQKNARALADVLGSDTLFALLRTHVDLAREVFGALRQRRQNAFRLNNILTKWRENGLELADALDTATSKWLTREKLRRAWEKYLEMTQTMATYELAGQRARALNTLEEAQEHMLELGHALGRYAK